MKIVNCFILCLFFLLSPTSAFHHSRDSLETLLRVQSGKEKLHTLIELSDYITYAFPVEAINLASEAIILSENINDIPL